MVAVVFTFLLVVGRKAVAAAAPTRYRHPSKGVALTRAFVAAPGFTKYHIHIQRSKKWLVHGLVKFATAVARLVCPDLLG